MSYINYSFYVIREQNNLEGIANSFRDLCERFAALGTILIAPEGINANLCIQNNRSLSDNFEQTLRSTDKDFETLWIKTSYGQEPSFKKLDIRIQPKILSYESNDNLSPDHIKNGLRINPEDFAKKFTQLTQTQGTTQNQPIVVDTRNQYEIDYGKFSNAVDFSINNFQEFIPKFLERFSDQKDQEFILYCTGGIRCEKAVADLNMMGFHKAKQLDGGILGYFEKMGSAHYQGDCFVFDNRWAVTPELTQSTRGPHPSQVPKSPNQT